jgi:hypothetical protein
MTQSTLMFDQAQEKPKLSRQCRRILEAFKRGGGRATNVELSEIALKYTGRLSDLRKAGYDVRVVEKGARGLRVYECHEA